RPDTFKESNDNKVTLAHFDPNTFGLFVGFLYYGVYIDDNDSLDRLKVDEGANAWALGDYLDAPEFKNVVMRFLHKVYFPPSRTPAICVEPEMAEYCCTMTETNSKLTNLFRDVLIAYWHSSTIISYNKDNRRSWDDIWDNYPELKSDVL
ncbi:hypothetical protein EK21DRAFT_44704, partial [Setomelanomma holmii]